ncbi:MAG: class D sortase [Chloroflexi bacterium]|nr:class D sortase [Chloroflexota bacterium]
MPPKRSVDKLSTEELRQALIQRQREDRQARLRNYQKTGRVVGVEPPPTQTNLEGLRSKQLEDVERERLEKKQREKRRWLDRLLLLLEVAAVVGLILLVFNGVSLLRNLNREVAASLQQPTLTPTALIMAVVLPSGHTPPNSPDGAQPNIAEIPEQLQPLVQSMDALPLPTSGPEQAVRIQIPAIDVDAPVVQGDNWEQLKKGVGQHSGTPDPGVDGNVVLSAHNDVYGEIFRNLDQLQDGDEVILFTDKQAYTYKVEKILFVEPTSVDILAQTTEPVVTLISCYPYMIDNQRIVVVASLVE